MKLIKTKRESAVWKQVQEAQQNGQPLPQFTGQDAEALKALLERFPAWEQAQKQRSPELEVRRRLAMARKWAYQNLLGFHRHQAMYHPDMLPWARNEGQTASDAEWIDAVKRAHAGRPIPIDGYDTEPVTALNLGRPAKLKREEAPC